MISISTCDNEGAFLNITFEPQLIKSPNLPIDRCFHTGNDFHKSFERLGGLGIQILFNLAICSSYSRINYVKMPVFQFLEKVNKGQLKS